MALAHLLSPARLIESHDFHKGRIVEVSYRRIIERDVPVLAKADEGEVDCVSPQQSGIALDFSSQIVRLASEIKHLLRT